MFETMGTKGGAPMEKQRTSAIINSSMLAVILFFISKIFSWYFSESLSANLINVFIMFMIIGLLFFVQRTEKKLNKKPPFGKKDYLLIAMKPMLIILSIIFVLQLLFGVKGFMAYLIKLSVFVNVPMLLLIFTLRNYLLNKNESTKYLALVCFGFAFAYFVYNFLYTFSIFGFWEEPWALKLNRIVLLQIVFTFILLFKRAKSYGTI